MAYWKGQCTVSCKLCETETKIQWKCVDCDLLMCDKCKETIHPKFKSARNHNVLSIKEIGLHSGDSNEIKTDFSDIKCEDHREQTCVLFCKQCNKFVCPRCIAKLHQKHNMFEITEAFEMKRKTLKFTQKTMLKKSEDLSKDLDKLQEMRKRQLSDADKIKQGILDHKSVLNNAVDYFSINLANEVDDKIKDIEKFIDREQNIVTKQQNQLQEKIKNGDSIVSKNIQKFFEEADDLENYIQQLPKISFSYSSLPIFHPGDITQINFGSLKDAEENEENFKCELKAIRELKTEFSSVGRIVICEDDSLWLCDNGTKINLIQNIKVTNDAIQVLSSIDGCVFDMELTPFGKILVSTQKLVLLTGNQSAMSHYSVEPLFPRAIHFTQNNELVVGATRENNLEFNPSNTSYVIVFDKNGHHKAKYESDKYGDPLFSLPNSITSTSNNKIVILDRFTKDHRGRVIILDTRNQFEVQMYKGHPEVNCKNSQFKPEDIKSTDKDNIIVLDMFNNTIHILDHRGNLLAYHNTMEAGIIGPVSMAIIRPGKLYIGCSTPLITSDKANLYEVELPGY